MLPGLGQPGDRVGVQTLVQLFVLAFGAEPVIKPDRGFVVVGRGLDKPFITAPLANFRKRYR